MGDNGIYSDGFQDGRHNLLDELAELFRGADNENEFAADVQSILEQEGAI